MATYREQHREIALEKLDDGEGKDWLVTEVYYSKGGANMFSGGREPRGYYLSVHPEGRDVSESGVQTMTIGMFSGIKSLIEPAARFSAKRLAEIVPDTAKLTQLRATVLSNREAEMQKRALAKAEFEKRKANGG